MIGLVIFAVVVAAVGLAGFLALMGLVRDRVDEFLGEVEQSSRGHW